MSKSSRNRKRRAAWQQRLPSIYRKMRLNSFVQTNLAILIGAGLFSDASSEGLLFPLFFLLISAVGLASFQVTLDNVQELSAHYRHTSWDSYPKSLPPLQTQCRGGMKIFVAMFMLGAKRAFQNLQLPIFSSVQADIASFFAAAVLSAAFVLGEYGAYQFVAGFTEMSAVSSSKIGV